MAAKTVLIVEDNEAVGALLFEIIRALGHEPVVIREGLRALRLLGLEDPSLGRALRPDLILLDVMLPDLDGYGVARRLEESPAHREIPIIMMTAFRQVEHVLAGLKGVRNSISKPFDARAVAKTISSALVA